MRRKRKCLCAVVLMLTSALTFLYVSMKSRPPPSVTNFRLTWVPSRITYAIKGAPPARQGRDLQLLPKPIVDDHVVNFKKEGIEKIYKTLTRLKETLTLQWRFLNSFGSRVDESELRRAWPLGTFNLLKYIRKVREGVHTTPGRMKTIDDMHKQVEILRTREFPSNPRPVKCATCFTYWHTSYIHPWSICEAPGEVDLLILVTSSPENKQARNTIRNTWGNYTKKNKGNVRLTFLLGRSYKTEVEDDLKIESQRRHDILQDDFHDNYYNISHKILGGLRWAMHSCSRAKYIMVAADDMFVNIPGLLQLIARYGRSLSFKRHLVGRCNIQERPYRWPDYKDYISTAEYDLASFPPYPEGSLFLTSNQLATELLQEAVNVPYFPRGDVYFGLLLEQLGRGCHDVEGLFLSFSGSIPSQPFFGLHPLSPLALEKNYTRLMMHSLTSLYRAP